MNIYSWGPALVRTLSLYESQYELGDTNVATGAKTIHFLKFDIFRKISVFWGFFFKIFLKFGIFENVHLSRPKRAENLINRKIWIFYIEAIPKNFSQLRKKIVRVQTKNVPAKNRPTKFSNSEKSWKKNKKTENFRKNKKIIQKLWNIDAN